MNIQNIPRDDKIVKGCFIPKLDALLFFDYKQIETRLLAYYLSAALDDESLKKVFQAERDIYSEVAKQIFHLEEEPSEQERHVAKTLVLSIIYGGGKRTVSKQLDLPQDAAADLLKRFHGEYPGIRKLQKRVGTRYQSAGYIRTLYGRRLRPQTDFKALNAVIQGSAAEILKHAMVRVHDHLSNRKSHIVLSIHDEIGVDAAKNEIELLCKTVPEHMKDRTVEAEGVPIEVDIEISYTSWADKEKYIPKGK